MLRRSAILPTLLAFALLAASCGGDSASEAAATTTTTTLVAPVTTAATNTAAPITAAPTTSAAPVEQAQITRSYVDESRITPATAESDELSSRTMDVWIDTPATAEPAPLIIFAHGLTGHPRSHVMHRTDLSANGFVVVAPAFPLTNNDVSGGFLNTGDIEGQVGDVSFLIDSVLADPDLAGRIDPDRIGMVGHSLGGLTTAGAAVGTDADVRINAAVVMSAGFGTPRPGVAVMVLHGDADLIVPYVSGTASYAQLGERRLLVTLVDGNHLEGIIDDDSELGVAVRGITAAFFATEFGVVGPSIDSLPLARLMVEAGDSEGVFDDWREYF
ncbi:MAG: acetyl esterase/lipase [Candidatus Aldehydirespiratoraceae bacterium]|jgi:acetyl esterase/lipase